MNGLHKIIVFFAFAFISNDILAIDGWKVVWSLFENTDTIYNIKDDKYKLYDNYFFPEKYFPLNREIYNAVKPFKKQHEVPNKIHLYFEKEFREPCVVELNDLMVNFRVYAHNILEYSVSITDGASIKLKQYFNVTYDGYQDYDFFDYIKNWDGADSIKDADGFYIKTLSIEAITSSKEYDFAIGNLMIFTKKDVEFEVKHPFFSFLNTSKKSYKEGCLKLDTSFIDSSITLSPSFSLFENSIRSNQLRLVRDSTKKTAITSEKDLFAATYSEVLEWYPFYAERGLNKNLMLSEFHAIQNDTFVTSIEDLAHKLSQLTNKFMDGHFSITIPKERIEGGAENKKVRSNIRLEFLNDKYYISAVFDTTLRKKMLLGKEVVTIDGKLLNKGLVTSNLLDRPNGQKALLHYINPLGNTDSVSISNNLIHDTPDNFIPKQCDFKLYNDKIAYFRINNFSQEVYLRFLNHLDKIYKAKGLIIDLRANGGGVLSIGQRLLSLFINKPAIYSHQLDYYGDKESIVVLPHKRIHLNIPVVILIDNRTACCSEGFAEAMRQNTNAILVGKSSTAGVYASLFELSFPSGIRVKIVGLDPKILVSSDKTIENVGITPDIWVKISEVQDLYPYNDKVRLIGKWILSH